jgi:hypothetical protein
MHNMVWDDARERAVVYGGQDGYNGFDDLWEWDGSTGTWDGPYAPAVRPAPRTQPTMVYDAAIGRTVLFGGGNDELWTWDGATHTWAGPFLPRANPGRTRVAGAAAYDSDRQMVIVHGGRGDGYTVFLSDVWETNALSAPQSALQFTWNYQSSQIIRPAITGLVVRADCGGTYDGQSGAALLGWNVGGLLTGASAPGPAGWTPLGAAGNTVAIADAQPLLPAPPGARLVFTAASADEARQYVLAEPRMGAVQCRPAGVAGAGTAAVAMDYVEVRVRYECLPAAAACMQGPDCCSDHCEAGACTAP